MPKQGQTKRAARLAAMELERRAWILHTEHGKTQPEIAAELHVTQSAVSKALRRAETKVADEIRGRVMTHKARQLARLEAVYRLAMQTYHASVGEQKTYTTETGPQGAKTKVTSRTLAGNPSALAEARGALADMRKLLGLDAPTKVSVVDAERPEEATSISDLQRELAEIYAAAGLSPTGDVH